MSHLRDLPRFWAGGLKVDAGDLDSSFSLPATALSAGLVTPTALGLTVFNATGGQIAAGQLVYVNGWNAAHNQPTIALAVATALATAAQYITLTPIANNGSGQVARALTVTGLNTNGIALGTAVFLDTNAGGYYVGLFPVSSKFFQVVGHVSVAAVAGAVAFDLTSNPPMFALVRQQSTVPTIPTTGAVDGILVMQQPGVLFSFEMVFKDALTADANNYVLFTLINLGPIGAGTTEVLVTSPTGVNGTKTPNGQSIPGFGNYGLGLTTPGPAAGQGPTVAAGDILQLTATVSGTLPHTVTEGIFSVAYVPS